MTGDVSTILLGDGDIEIEVREELGERRTIRIVSQEEFSCSFTISSRDTAKFKRLLAGDSEPGDLEPEDPDGC